MSLWHSHQEQTAMPVCSSRVVSFPMDESRITTCDAAPADPVSTGVH
jgi:hypothetical protein